MKRLGWGGGKLILQDVLSQGDKDKLSAKSGIHHGISDLLLAIENTLTGGTECTVTEELFET